MTQITPRELTPNSNQTELDGVSSAEFEFELELDHPPIPPQCAVRFENRPRAPGRTGSVWFEFGSSSPRREGKERRQTSPRRGLGTTRAPRQERPRRTAPGVDKVSFGVRSGFATTVSGRPRWPTSRPRATNVYRGHFRRRTPHGAACGVVWRACDPAQTPSPTRRLNDED